MKIKNVKVIIGSDNIQRDCWYDLIQLKKDIAVTLCDTRNGRDYRKNCKAGDYLIEMQVNRQNACCSYSEISKSSAERCLEMDIDDAVEYMMTEF